MATWKTDEQLFKLVRQSLTTCALSDVLGQLGFSHPVLPPEIRPLQKDMVIIGRAMPVQDEPPVPHGAPVRFDTKPFGLLPESIEALRPGEVYIASGGPINSARLGDVLILRAQKLGAAGIVLNARVRNAKPTLELNIPVFSRGSYAHALQQRHNVVDFRCSITVEGVRVKPGDLIFGDQDGVCVLPHEAEQEVINQALERIRLESGVRAEVESGRSIVEAFASHGVR